MELYASGFNAHGQLLPSHSPPDLLAFRRIASGASTIRVRCATWSATVLEIDGVLELRGCLPGEGRDEVDERGGKSKVAVLRGLPADEIKTIVGDGSGVLGALTTEGEIWVLDGRGGRDDRELGGPDGSMARLLSWVQHDLDLSALQASAGFPAREGGEMVIDQIAVAGNDRVCISAHTRKLLPLKPAKCELSCLHSLKKTNRLFLIFSLHPLHISVLVLPPLLLPHYPIDRNPPHVSRIPPRLLNHLPSPVRLCALHMGRCALCPSRPPSQPGLSRRPALPRHPPRHPPRSGRRRSRAPGAENRRGRMVGRRSDGGGLLRLGRAAGGEGAEHWSE